MKTFIKYLEKRIEGCEALGGMGREKSIYQSVLKEYKKQLLNYSVIDKEKILAYHKYLTEELRLNLDELWVDKFVEDKLIDNSVSLLDTIDQLIELYEERLTVANKTKNYIGAHNNQFGIDVLDHLKSVVKHNSKS